ncbi:MAG: CehA/McbA family metallohydrolase [Actinomycetota bacterium]
MSRWSLRRSVAARILVAAAAAAVAIPIAAGPAGAGGTGGTSGIGAAIAAPAYTHYVGAVHEHSGYSDGQPLTRPADYFAQAKSLGLDFMGSGEHSDNARIPVTLSDACLGTGVVDCVPGDSVQPENGVRKWEATLEQAKAATDTKFTAFRGFEWTSDRFGHINVYFSRNDANAKIDGGYAGTTETFWKWFTTRPELGGGSDGLAVFNHPGGKSLSDVDPGMNWSDFAYVPSADDRMVGIEVYNDKDNYDVRGPAEGYYVHALDRGWHLGALSGEDIHTTDWGKPAYPKTIVMATDRSEPALRAAMLARRFYTVRDSKTRLDFSVNDAIMGSRIAVAEGAPLTIAASISDPLAAIEIVTSGGRIVAQGTGSLQADIPASSADRYYFMRARHGSDIVAYGSPVWVSQKAASPVGEWLAGDLHVHTVYSHDSWSGPDDDNTGIDEFYTLGLNPEGRFLQASLYGLDYLALTDHGDVRSITDPGFGTHGVIGLPGYENSVDGHAQMLGAKTLYDNGDSSATRLNAIAADLRAQGGLFQINHPASDVTQPLTSCENMSGIGWGYGYDVVPDTIEVWNTGFYLQKPAPAGMSNDSSIRYWECFLDRGHHIGATAGSDSHWLSTSAIQGPGDPTTWVFSQERSPRAIFRAVREGRTSVSLLPPLKGGLRLVLEADANSDGVYEAMIGDTVPTGTPMRVRAEGLPGAGLVDVRANDQTIVSQAVLTPGGEAAFKAPAKAGWVYASLMLPDGLEARRAACDPILGSQTSYCRDHLLMAAITSAIYLAQPTSLVITAPDFGRYGDQVEISATLKAGDTPLAGRSVEFKLAGITGTAITNTAGVATFSPILNSDPAKTAIEVSFAGENSFSPVKASKPFEIKPEVTNLVYTGEALAKGEEIRVAGVLTEDDGAPLAGRAVVFEVKAKGIKQTAITDGGGRAEITMTVPDHGNSQTVEVSFAGDSRYEASDLTQTINWGQGQGHNDGMISAAATRLAATGVPVLAAALILLARLRRRRMEES